MFAYIITSRDSAFAMEYRPLLGGARDLERHSVCYRTVRQRTPRQRDRIVGDHLHGYVSNN